MEEKKETRVGLYAELRRKIEQMNTVSLDDIARERKNGTGLYGDDPDSVYGSYSSQQLCDPHIKKNTLSISIDELIKQNDSYKQDMERKELNKKYRSVRRKQKKLSHPNALRLILLSVSIIIILVVIVLVALRLGGVL